MAVADRGTAARIARLGVLVFVWGGCGADRGAESNDSETGDDSAEEAFTACRLEAYDVYSECGAPQGSLDHCLVLDPEYLPQCLECGSAHTDASCLLDYLAAEITCAQKYQPANTDYVGRHECASGCWEEMKTCTATTDCDLAECETTLSSCHTECQDA